MEYVKFYTEAELRKLGDYSVKYYGIPEVCLTNSKAPLMTMEDITKTLFMTMEDITNLLTERGFSSEELEVLIDVNGCSPVFPWPNVYLFDRGMRFTNLLGSIVQGVQAERGMKELSKELLKVTCCDNFRGTDHDFCLTCGKRLENLTCCDKSREIKFANFCGNCGKPLTEAGDGSG